jgi:predicted aminopeptidase
MNNLEKIELIKDIKKFAVHRLGISPNPSFKKVGGGKTFHSLYASRTDKLESIITGRYRNLGYTDKEKEECKRDEKLLISKGHDVLRITFEAVGSENCPITDSMLKSSKTRLAYLVLHENFHIHCIKNPVKFNVAVEEAIADCFAYQGSLMYFASKPSMVGNIKRDFEEWQEFYDFANKYILKLENAYEDSKIKGRRLLGNAKREIKKLSENTFSKEIKERSLLPINNAFFLRLKSYAPMARPVYEAFKDMDPKTYVTNRKKLNAILRKIN